MRSATIARAALAAVVVVGAVVALAPRSRTGEGSEAATRAWPRPAAGVLWRYRVSAESSGVADAAALTGGGGDALAARVVVGGTLELLRLDSGPGAERSAVRLEDASVVVHLGGGAGDPRALRDELARWTFVHADGEGRVERLAPPEAQPPDAAGLVASLVAALQVVPPPGAGAAAGTGKATGTGADAAANPCVGPGAPRVGCTWTSEESDPSGRAVVRYEVEPATTARSLHLRKRVLRYVPGPRRPGELPDARSLEPTGEARLRLSRDDGHLESLELDAGLATRTAGRLVGDTRTRLRLTALGAEAPPPARLAELAQAARRAGPGAPLFADGVDAHTEEAFQRAQLGDLTAEQVLARLASDGGPTSDEDRTELSLTLEALLRLRPDSADALLRRVLAGGLFDDAEPLAADALSRAGTAESGAALLALLRARRDDPEALATLLPIVGHVASPSAALVDVLRALAASGDDDAAWNARLTLGVLARNLRDAEPARAASLVDEALARVTAAPLADATDDDTRALVRWLLVLGNAGPATPADARLALSRHPRAELRAAACWALRFEEGEAARSRLLEVLAGDREPAARVAAVRALSLRGEEAPGAVLDAEVRALERDAAADVRRAALTGLGQRLARVPALAEAVARVAERDPEAAIRAQAARLVASLAATVRRPDGGP